MGCVVFIKCRSWKKIYWFIWPELNIYFFLKKTRHAITNHKKTAHTSILLYIFILLQQLVDWFIVLVCVCLSFKFSSKNVHVHGTAKSSLSLYKPSSYIKFGLPSWLQMFRTVQMLVCAHSIWIYACFFFVFFY